MFRTWCARSYGCGTRRRNWWWGSGSGGDWKFAERTALVADAAPVFLIKSTHALAAFTRPKTMCGHDARLDRRCKQEIVEDEDFLSGSRHDAGGRSICSCGDIHLWRFVWLAVGRPRAIPGRGGGRCYKKIRWETTDIDGCPGVK